MNLWNDLINCDMQSPCPSLQTSTIFLADVGGCVHEFQVQKSYPEAVFIIEPKVNSTFAILLYSDVYSDHDELVAGAWCFSRFQCFSALLDTSEFFSTNLAVL
ncbi:unnamed protein product [Cylicocyclus nassatus]|uniref:Uncharacterized protein n=1 Tax=Cylicocyclus nassatus TaxID=53992 RepID=A0AA36H6I8_CYLNA|nr:unnamed protein product [Cylicocyclus nassatus]